MPLHHFDARDRLFLVATSGNCPTDLDEAEALRHCRIFLVSSLRHADDSVARIMRDGTVRAARYAIARSIEIASTSAARARRTVKRGRYYGRPQAHQPAYRRPNRRHFTRFRDGFLAYGVAERYLYDSIGVSVNPICRAAWPLVLDPALSLMASCMAENARRKALLNGTDTRMKHGEFSPMVQILNALLRSRFRLQGDAPVSVGVLQTGGEFFERVATFWRDGFTLRSACCSNRCSKRACILAHLEQLFDAVSALTGLASTLVSGQAARA